MTVNLTQHNASVYRSKHLSRWRCLYLEVAREMHPDSVIEFGAGNAALLERLPDLTVRAVDGSEQFRPSFDSAGIALDVHDLNEPGYVAPQKFGKFLKK